MRRPVTPVPGVQDYFRHVFKSLVMTVSIRVDSFSSAFLVVSALIHLCLRHADDTTMSYRVTFKKCLILERLLVYCVNDNIMFEITDRLFFLSSLNKSDKYGTLKHTRGSVTREEHDFATKIVIFFMIIFRTILFDPLDMSDQYLYIYISLHL